MASGGYAPQARMRDNPSGHMHSCLHCGCSQCWHLRVCRAQVHKLSNLQVIATHKQGGARPFYCSAGGRMGQGAQQEQTETGRHGKSSCWSHSYDVAKVSALLAWLVPPSYLICLSCQELCLQSTVCRLTWFISASVRAARLKVSASYRLTTPFMSHPVSGSEPELEPEPEVEPVKVPASARPACGHHMFGCTKV